jgi:dipeptidyl aminopeptidase/acylaminoacyl peptidase
MIRRLELDDLTRFVSVSNPQLSPDLNKVAFVVSSADEKLDDFKSTIWIINRSNGRPLRFLSGWKDRHPRWSPDGQQLFFISDRGLEKGEKGSGLWISPINGGEPRLVLRMEMGIEEPQWSMDGSKVFFISGVGEDERDVRVINRIPIWFNAAGYTYYRRKHLHVVDVVSGVVTRLTEGEMNVVCASPSNSGRAIAYTASTDDLDPRRVSVYIYNIHSDEHVALVDGYYVESICWAPDDSRLSFLGNDLSRGYATHNTVWILPINGGAAQNITKDLDKGCSRRAYYDIRSPFAGIPAPIWDGDHIYFPVSDGGRFNLFRVGIEDGNTEPVVAGDFSLEEFSVRDGVIAYTRVTGTEPAEVWVRDEEGERRITGFNDDLLSRLNLSEPERFGFEASDGQGVDGWILKPYGLKEGEKRSTILDIHGGPMSKFGDSFMFEHQLYAAEGYAVIYLNPRGSDGYDQEFADIRGIYGTKDYRDIMEAVDHVVTTFSFIDPERLGVTGLSYGGFMTNWIMTQTDRFSAAISQNGISHWPSFYGTSDIGFHFTPDQIGDKLWSNEEDYRDKSPLTYAPKVTTPIMFIHSYEDYRCWIDQSIIFYTALKHLGKETQLVLFMEGSHVFRSLARPSIRKKRYEHMIEWFDTHLKNELRAV